MEKRRSVGTKAGKAMLFLLSFLLFMHDGVRGTDATIKIIGTGTGRTGSTTLQEALEILGYKTYHPKEIVTGGKGRAPEMEFWLDAFETGCKPRALREIFERWGYNATVHAINFPCHDSLIFDVYPEAKVIHTQRASAELWHDSVTNSICKLSFDSWTFRVVGFFFPIIRSFGQLQPLLMGRVIFGADGPVDATMQYCAENKERMIDFYNSHNSRIKEVVPPERLLVISNHKDGWAPICDFLGIPIPNIPFPHANKRESMMKSLVSALANRYDNFSLEIKLLVVLVALLAVVVVARGRVWKSKPKSD